jgi:uroporphyrinogen-III synthase
VRGEFDIVIFLTGVGTRALVNAIAGAVSLDAFVEALAKTRVVARGPKPVAVLRELQVPLWIIVPEPNTWRELLAALDAKADERPLGGARIAVQEYGVSNVELLSGLGARGALVTRVPVYQWMLPEDTRPLRNAVVAIDKGEVDIVVFTTSVQVVHLWQIAVEMRLEAELRRGLAATVIASIGPSTSEELARHGLAVDIEASHPKLGILIRDVAARATDLIHVKRHKAD